MPPFVHLHAHSAYSLAEGAVPIAQLSRLCMQYNMPALAITDRNNLFGALEVSETFSTAGIQPIIGIQMDMQSEDFGGICGHNDMLPWIVLLAQNEAGYQNLLKLTSAAFLRPPMPGVTCSNLDVVAAHAQGVICLTGGLDGPVDRLLHDGRHTEAMQALEKLASIFPHRLYVEIQRHGKAGENSSKSLHENHLLQLSYDMHLPIVATNGVYFTAPEDYDAHDALLCIAAGTYIEEDNRRRVHPQQYFKSDQEMTSLFADLPEAIENTSIIAQRCAFRPRLHAPILPGFTTQDGTSEASELHRQATQGLTQRLQNTVLAMSEDAYRDRLHKELDIINSMGFPGYFLIVADFIQWAKQEGIPVGPGRGSGAGSLVAWALTITDLDPLRFGLLFERFLNPERVSMPDFDVDFCQDRRDEVITYVQQKYGADRVAQIITFGKLQARAVLRDVGRVLHMPFGQVDRLCKVVPNNPAAPVTLREAINAEPKLREERDSDPRVADLLTKALKLEGLYRHASTHAAGVVIGDRALDELVPLYLDPRSDMPATQFNMKWVEPAGLVKFDFLGLKTLTVIQRAIQLVEKKGGHIDLANISLDDHATYEMLGQGAATGVFQLESTGMRATLRALKPDNLEDIIALVSLYRPGPMDNIPTYIDRKFGREKPDYLHPLLEEILKETYGVIIYQEQVMQIAQVLSGYSLGEADLLRRAMGKKKKEEMDQQRIRFVQGAKEKGVPTKKAEDIFDLVAKFAGYGFNKSHAAAYALIAYQTAWLKANYTAEFLAASMSLDRANTDKLAIFITEAKRCNVDVIAPNLNRSATDFTVVDGAIIYALSAVKNVGEQAVNHIVATRKVDGPFKDIYDFAERVDGRQIGKRMVENLVRAGALDDIHANRAELIANIDFIMRYSASITEEQNSAQAGLFGAETGAQLDRPALKKRPEWGHGDRLNYEYGAIGFYFSGHPLDAYAADIDRMNVTRFNELATLLPSEQEGYRKQLTMAGIIRNFTLRRSKKGKPFAWVEVSDPTGAFEVTAFSEVLETMQEVLAPGSLVLLSVTAEVVDTDIRLTCDGVRALDKTMEHPANTSLRIMVATPDAVEAVKQRLVPVPAEYARPSGGVTLVLFMPDTGFEVEVCLPVTAPADKALQGALKTIDGVLEVGVQEH